MLFCCHLWLGLDPEVVNQQIVVKCCQCSSVLYATNSARNVCIYLFKVPPGGVTALTSINFYRQMEKKSTKFASNITQQLHTFYTLHKTKILGLNGEQQFLFENLFRGIEWDVKSRNASICSRKMLVIWWSYCD